MKKHDWVEVKDDSSNGPGSFPDASPSDVTYQCSQCGIVVQGFGVYGVSPRHTPKGMDSDCDEVVVRNVMSS